MSRKTEERVNDARNSELEALISVVAAEIRLDRLTMQHNTAKIEMENAEFEHYTTTGQFFPDDCAP